MTWAVLSAFPPSFPSTYKEKGTDVLLKHIIFTVPGDERASRPGLDIFPILSTQLKG